METFGFNQRIFTEMKRLVLFHSLLPACWQTNSTWRLRRRRGGSSTSSVTPDLMPRSTQNWWGSAFADPDELQITERKQPWLLIWVVTLCIYLLVRELFLKYFKISPWRGEILIPASVSQGHVVMGNNAVSPYQQVIEKTKSLSFRSQMLAMNIEKRLAHSNRNEVIWGLKRCHPLVVFVVAGGQHEHHSEAFLFDPTKLRKLNFIANIMTAFDCNGGNKPPFLFSILFKPEWILQDFYLWRITVSMITRLWFHFKKIYTFWTSELKHNLKCKRLCLYLKIQMCLTCFNHVSDAFPSCYCPLMDKCGKTGVNLIVFVSVRYNHDSWFSFPFLILQFFSSFCKILLFYCELFFPSCQSIWQNSWQVFLLWWFLIWNKFLVTCTK